MILPKTNLTASGRPQLTPGEIERVLLDKVDLEFEGIGGTAGCQTADRYQSGYAVVTSHRLIWIDTATTSGAGRSCYLPLDSIHSTNKRIQYSLNLMHPKIRLELKVYVDLKSQPTNRQASATFRYLQLRCRGEGPDAFNEHLNAAMEALKQQQEREQHRQQQQPSAAQWQQPPSRLQQQRQPATPWVGATTNNAASISWSDKLPPSPRRNNTPLPQHYKLPNAAAASPVAVAAPRPIVAVDEDLLGSLLDMGFPRARVLRALVATGSEHLQAALDWILAAGEDPTMDQPYQGPEPAAVSKQELQHLQRMQAEVSTAAASAAYAPAQQQIAAALQPGWGLGTVGAAGLSTASFGGSSTGNTSMMDSLDADGWEVVGGLDAFGVCSGGTGPSSAAAGYVEQQQGARPATASGSRVIGVAGIMHREAEKTSQTSAHLAAAFQDLNNLMGMAADMVKLAEKFRGVMGPDGSITLSPGPDSGTSTASRSDSPAAGTEAGSNAGNGGGDLLLDAETQLQLIAMGIASPVTRASAGARYQQELSRQLADFLEGPLAKAGGVMLLPDVYCLFNRARGTELVSPDDVMQACEACTQLHLPLRLRKFPSGVIVVQGSQFSDKQLCSKIEQLMQQKAAQKPDTLIGDATAAPALGPPLSATDVSVKLALPLTLAREALFVAESAGVLCRDDGPEGLRFFRNFFRECQPIAVL